jgi:hypothetical protein
MRDKVRRLKAHISNHRARYAATGTAVVLTTAFLKLQFRNAEILNAFLKEHNLYDEYYQMDEI